MKTEIENNIIDIKKIKSEFNKISIKCIEAKFDIYNQTSITIINLEEYIELAKQLNINNIFYSAYYHDINEYIIDYYYMMEEEYNETINEKIYKLIEPSIKQYNEKVKALDFDRPYELSLLFIHDGVNYECNLNDEWLEDYEDSESALDSIIDDYSDTIEEIQNEEIEVNKEEIDKLKLELKEKILNYEEFPYLTNMRLRTAFARDFIKSGEFEKYKKCFTNKKGFSTNLDFIDWVELLWKDYKEQKRRDSINLKAPF